MKKLFSIFLASALLCGLFYTVMEIQAKQNYLGYLKRAADAGSVDLAKSELSKAVIEIERRGLTSGYTAILWKTPDQDIGFWYLNLKGLLKDLEGLSEDSSPMEKSNMLMKLRESLLDDTGKNGVKVTYPDGVSIYPYNRLFALWATLSFVGAFVGYFFFRRERFSKSIGGLNPRNFVKRF